MHVKYMIIAKKKKELSVTMYRHNLDVSNVHDQAYDGTRNRRGE